jgi:hypothetical protein
MQSFLALPEGEQRDSYEAAVPALGLPAVSIEKDLWVTWILRELFALPDWGPQFTFKGGTSLSKCWKLIDRFSEDIDLVIDRAFLGFGGDTLTGKEHKKLRKACSSQVHHSLAPALRDRLGARLPKRAAWSLDLATIDEDPEEQTLKFAYPTVFPVRAGYVNPIVRIELGARSDTEPHESPRIRPMLADAFPDLIPDSDVAVRSVAARRTFWEKALLLHEETYRPADRRRKPRLSRHYYDLHQLIERGVASQALADQGLLERVVAHRREFFDQSWMDYDTMRRGRLRVSPLPEQEPGWRSDYEAMKGEMFFGDPPSFDAVLATVRRFESEVNRS